MRNNKFKTGTRMSVFVAACLLAIPGCCIEPGQKVPTDADRTKYRVVTVLAPTDIMFGGRRRLGTFPHKESVSWFEKKIVLKEGFYDVLGLCREIERITGKMVTWVPPLKVASNDDMATMRVMRVGEGSTTREDKEDDVQRIIPKKVKLEYLIDTVLAFATEAGLGDQSAYYERPTEEEPPICVWVAIVTEKRIVFVLLPGKTYDEN